MINSLHIQGLKSIEDQVFEMSPLTIVTGLNSTGKSTLLQSVLLIARDNSNNGARFLADIQNRFEILRNKYTKAEEIKVSMNGDGGIKCELSMNRQMSLCTCVEETPGPVIEHNFFYLSANRIGPENMALISNDKICGLNGEALFGTYEKEKSKPLREELIKDGVSYTLSTQVNYWLRYILGLPIELYTNEVNQMTAEVKYKSDGIPDIMPSELGAGVSYLAKILILCLRAEAGDLVMIENPEIHLHPAAQSRLGEFLAFIAARGTQIIIETHCDNLINRVRYEVYAGRMAPSDVTIYYKEAITSPFIKIGIKRDGGYDRDFPEGFFDATLAELIEMD